MQVQEEGAAGSSQAVDIDFSLHWITQMMHEASKVGVPVHPRGTWSSPHDQSHELLMRFSNMLTCHEHSPPAVLRWLSSFDDAWLQERIAEHPNTPGEVLNRLSQCKHPHVRAAVAEHPSAPFDLLFALARDEHPDVRYRLAENSALPEEILNILAADENPYVAHRAEKSLRHRSHKLYPSQPAVCDRLNVLIVDDDDVTRLILSLALKSDPLINVVGQASSGEAGRKLAIEHEPDLVLMDISMPGMDGIAAAEEIKSMLPDTRVIMVTSHGTVEEILSAFGRGAEGFHLKSTPNHDLAKAIRVVASGSYWLDPGIASMVLRELSNKSFALLQEMALATGRSADTELSDPVRILLASSDEYARLDRITEARKITQSALALSNTLHGGQAATTRDAMLRLAELYFLEEEFGSSESTYLELMDLVCQLQELGDPALEHYLLILAEFYEFRSNWDQAELFYAWILRIHESKGAEAGIAEIRSRLAALACRREASARKSQPGQHKSASARGH